MKKIIYKSLSILALFVSITSCSPEEEKIDFLSVGGNVVLTDTKISRLDTNNDIKFKVLLKEGVSVTKIEIYKNAATASANPVILGTKLSDGVINGAVATFKSSALIGYPQFASNLTTATGNITLAVKTNYSDGTSTINPFTLAVARGVNWRILNSDGDEVDSTSSTSLLTSAMYLDPTVGDVPGVNLLKYKTYKKYSTTIIASVTVEWKKNVGGTYAPVSGTFANDEGTIDLGTLPTSSYGLVVGDDLFYKVTVKGTDGQTDFVTAKVSILSQEFGDEKSATLFEDLAKNKFSFKTGLNYENVELLKAEINYQTATGITVEGTTSISFVKSNTTNYDTADLFVAKADFNAGSASSSIPLLVNEDVIIYKISRTVATVTKEYFGIIKIGNITTLNAAGTKNIDFSYKEGSLIL